MPKAKADTVENKHATESLRNVIKNGMRVVRDADGHSKTVESAWEAYLPGKDKKQDRLRLNGARTFVLEIMSVEEKE